VADQAAHLLGEFTLLRFHLARQAKTTAKQVTAAARILIRQDDLDATAHQGPQLPAVFRGRPVRTRPAPLGRFPAGCSCRLLRQEVALLGKYKHVEPVVSLEALGAGGVRAAAQHADARWHHESVTKRPGVTAAALTGAAHTERHARTSMICRRDVK